MSHTTSKNIRYLKPLNIIYLAAISIFCYLYFVVSLVQEIHIYIISVAWAIYNFVLQAEEHMQWTNPFCFPLLQSKLMVDLSHARDNPKIQPPPRKNVYNIKLTNPNSKQLPAKYRKIANRSPSSLIFFYMAWGG